MTISATVQAPLARRPTPELVAEHLRRALERGALRPGSRLGEVALARRLGIGRGSLREGLERLVHEGVLQKVANRGTFVPRLSIEDARDVYLAREVLEVAAVRRLVARRGATERIDRRLRTLVAAVRTGRWPAIVEADLAFHEALVAAAGSARLGRMFATLATETRLCLQALGPTYSQFSVLVREHREIVTALQHADADGAANAIAEHMADAVRRLDAAGSGPEPARSAADRDRPDRLKGSPSPARDRAPRRQAGTSSSRRSSATMPTRSSASGRNGKSRKGSVGRYEP